LISIAQVRAARGLIGWSKARLAEAADLPLQRVKRYEKSARLEIPEEDFEALRHALEAAGIEFLNGGQPGVRLKPAAVAVSVDQLNSSNDE
jgi:transcriptional regulator with XRE-family HTH domain